MSDLPRHLTLCEEGPREGFQIEPGPISSDDKIALINALSRTGVPEIQVCSFVSPRLVPGWADADAVVSQMEPDPSVKCIALWFNQKGLDRAMQHRDQLTLEGSIHLAASEAFCISNLNRDRLRNLEAMRKQTRHHLDANVPVNKLTIMAAFGCNFAGNISEIQVTDAIQDGLAIAAEANTSITDVALCDTMGWANPSLIENVVGTVRTRWPDLTIHLHLHDTRGLGIANAQAGLRLGVTHFDTTVGGLGGCPFAAHKGAPGNIATEELVMLAEEQGIETGIDLDALIEAGHMAERIVGHRLPSAALRGGSLAAFRARAQKTRSD